MTKLKEFMFWWLICTVIALVWLHAHKAVENKAPETKETAEQLWDKEYKEKTAWLKPCKTEQAKYYHNLVMVCDKKKWKVGGVI